VRIAPGARSLRLALAALAAGCAVALAGVPAGAGTRADATTELYVFYVGSSSLQVKLNGNVVRSGGSIPAGSYLVLVSDDDDLNPQFRMSGPGVSISSNLNSTGMGIDSPSTFGPFNLSGSYTVQDAVIGAASLTTFSTTGGSGGASTGGTTSGTSGGTSGGSSGGSGGSQSSGSTAGMGGATKMVGTLKGSVSGARVTLTFNGRAPKSLKAGRYTVSVSDRSKTAGMIIGTGAKRPITLSGAAATGTSSRSVTLTAGKWFFAASASGAKTYFTVTR